MNQELAEPITTRHEWIAFAFRDQSQPETAGGLDQRDSSNIATLRIALSNQFRRKRAFDPGELNLCGLADWSFYLHSFGLYRNAQCD
jgi:hypothetical protein